MKFLEKVSIKVQLFIIAITTMLIIFLIILSVYTQINDVFTEKNDEYAKELIYQIEKKVDNNCDLVNHIVKNIAFNKIVQDYLLEEKLDDKYEIFKEVDKYVNNMMNLKEGIIDIAIKSSDGSIYYKKEGSNISADRDFILKDRVSIYYSGMEEYNDKKDLKKCFVVATNVFSIDPNRRYNENIGTIYLFLDVNSIVGNTEKILSKQTNTNLYLIDRNGKIFLSNDNRVDENVEELNLDEEAFLDKVNDERCIIGMAKLPYINGKIVSRIPKNELLYDISVIKNRQIMIIIIAFLILAIPFSITIRNIIRPLRKFKIFTAKINSGNMKGLKSKIELGGYSEMVSVSYEFNSMMEEVNSLTHRLLNTSSKLYEAEIETKQAELAYLRSQINPHFLYNTLESIKGIAADNEVPEIINMTKALGKVFKYSAKGLDTVLLEEEVKVVKSYIYIQLIRFENRFSVTYNISDEALLCNVPKMILQPIVENSIFYGLEPLRDKGELTIDAKIDSEDNLIIVVEDNGKGMDDVSLANIRKQLDNDDSSTLWENTRSIGLSNVNNRIRLRYGKGYGLTIDSEDDKGTKVTYKLPGKVK
ncbi:sensor histidine kinase [Vallitalea maricola]|uniref:Two-component system sensor histidine kinase YesM n=1 Tax=Vallitalea maricola TaxID=3074433 RepID=A0ACB5UFI9_9FIRM|nr:two-component system sensor histidine kinase YesM [Vallitalea sp. AN17-2]